MDIFMKLFARDLDKLIAEVNMYKRDGNLWRIAGDVKNSAGNLCLHIIGNLQHFIGAVIGETGYIRDREAEFSTTAVSRDILLSALLETKEIVIDSLQKLDRKNCKKFIRSTYLEKR
jgi:ribosomal protein S8